MLLGKPFRIEVMHKYPEAKLIERPDTDTSQKTLDEHYVDNMDAVIKSINEVLGVKYDEDNH